MNMSSAGFIDLMTTEVFREAEGPPTIHVNGCFHFRTCSHGSGVRPLYSVCSFMLYLCMMLYIAFVIIFYHNHFLKFIFSI